MQNKESITRRIGCKRTKKKEKKQTLKTKQVFKIKPRCQEWDEFLVIGATLPVIVQPKHFNSSEHNIAREKNNGRLAQYFTFVKSGTSVYSTITKLFEQW